MISSHLSLSMFITCNLILQDLEPRCCDYDDNGCDSNNSDKKQKSDKYKALSLTVIRELEPYFNNILNCDMFKDIQQLLY